VPCISKGKGGGKGVVSCLCFYKFKTLIVKLPAAGFTLAEL
jgi:hypothetical protein